MRLHELKLSKKEEKAYIAFIKETSDVILDTENIKIINTESILSRERYYRDTDWSPLDDPHITGNLSEYIIIDKKTNKKYQLNLFPQPPEIKNKNNKKLNLSKFLKKYPEVYNEFKKTFENKSKLEDS